MSEENVEVVRRVFENAQTAYKHGHFQESLSVEAGLLDPDFELVPAAELTTEHYRGYDGWERFMQNWTEGFDQWSFELEQLVDAGHDRVVAVARQRGIGKESGVPVDLEFGMLYELNAGRVTRVRVILDPASALEAAGLSE
jgi:ketosteroid isomerase-like protein